MKTEKEYRQYRENGILRLTKRQKKGILTPIFSRFLIITLLLILQFLLISGFFVWIDEFKPFFHIMTGLILFFAMVYLFSCDMDPTGKLTWLFFIALFPIPITLFLAYTRLEVGHRRIKRRVGEIIDETQNLIPQNEGALRGISVDDRNTGDLVRWLNHSGCFPVFVGVETEYHDGGQSQFEAILRELAAAKEYIFLESFIIKEGYMWGSVLEILMKKAQEGLDVRVMYDGMCELAELPWDYAERLQSFGIKAKAFAPIRPVFSSQYNYRDHRKILVIDGNVAFTGGINMADEYIGREERFGVWKDAGLMVRGNAARSFTLMFLQMWNIDDPEAGWEPCMKDYPSPQLPAEGYVVPYSDCPIDDFKVGKTVYTDILNRAGKYVHIMTPYLILDAELENAIKYAAQRGVEVKLILPGIPDKKTAYALAKSYYRILLDAGAKIYEYTPGFVHAKVFVCDDCRAVVGTINLDYRSLYHHYECAAYMYKTPCIADAEKDFANTLAQCREVTYESIRNESLYNKVMGKLLRFVAPLM